MIELRFRGDDIRTAIDAILKADLDRQKRYILKIAECKDRRSAQANAYFWEFLDKLAVRMRMGKTELYRQLIQDIGGVSDIIYLKNEAVASFVAHWEERGRGWFCDTEDIGNGWTVVTAYYGSSSYDTAQMSRLIDRLLWECEAVGGIDTTDLKTKALLQKE